MTKLLLRTAEHKRISCREAKATNNSSPNLLLCSKIVPLLMLMFVLAATNEAIANPWPQNLPSPPADVFNVRWWSTGGYLHIGANDWQTSSVQTNWHHIIFGAGPSGNNLGIWQIGAERQGFRIGRAWNNTIASGIPHIEDGGTNLLFLNENGVVGINLSNPWTASFQHRNQSNVVVSSDVRFRVNGSTVAKEYYKDSDRRYKTGIEPINNLQNLFGLNAVQYRPSSEGLKEQLEIFKQQYKDLPEERFNAKVSSFEKQIAETDANTFLHFGFIAQDLQKLFPNLVIEDEQGFLAVNYVSLIPVLVGAIQEQQKILEAQQKQLDELRNRSFEKTGTNSLILNDARLYQNTPNPFNNSTEIKFFVPESSNTAGIYIYDMIGKELLKLDITQRGNSSVILNASQLNAGMYLYSLIIDGKEIDTKKMILTTN